MTSSGRNNGKKQMAVRIIKQTMELIHLLTGLNPIQVLVDAITNSGAREDSTRIGSGGVVRRQAVDVSPLRRVNQAIYLICKGSRTSAFRSLKSMPECLADEIIAASKVRINPVSLCQTRRLALRTQTNSLWLLGSIWQLFCLQKEGRDLESLQG